MKKNVLIIDDENVFRMLNEKIILFTGIDCHIESVSSGDEALMLLDKAIPDFIFIDLDMPMMDGFEFVRRFQSTNLPNTKNTTLIILTSSIDDKDRRRATELGVHHFVSKPLSEKDVRLIFTGEIE